MPNSLDQNGVGFPAGKPSRFNYPQTGDFRTEVPQTDMYPRAANHLWKLFSGAAIELAGGLNFYNLTVAGTWFEVNLFGYGYDGSLSLYPLFVKLNDPSNAIGDGFFGNYVLGPVSGSIPSYTKPIRVRGIPFNKLYFSLITNATSDNFYLHLSWGTDTDANRVDLT